MGLQKNKHEQMSVAHFGEKHAMANRYGTKKKKNEQLSVGHFCGKHAMGAKKTETFHFFVCRSVLFCGHQRKWGHFCRWPENNTDLRNCSRFSKRYTKPASEDQTCPRQTLDIIFKLMCPRWASFSNFKLAGHIQKRKLYGNKCRGNERFFCVSFFLYCSGSIAVGPRYHQLTSAATTVSARSA